MKKGFKLLESLPEIYGITVLEDGKIKMTDNLEGNKKLHLELLN